MNIEHVITGLKEYGPLGLFLAAFVSNLIPGFPAVYLTLVGAVGGLVRDPVEALLTVVSAGVGAGLGKVVVFYTSNVLASRSEHVRRKREEYSWLISRTKVGLFILVFLFAALPLPDDVLYIPLGISGFSPAWFAAGVILGKIVLTAIVLLLGHAYWSLIGSSEAGNWTVAIGGFLVGTIILSYIIFTINWKKVYFAYKDEGLKTGTIVFLYELFSVLTLKPLRERGRGRRDEGDSGL